MSTNGAEQRLIEVKRTLRNNETSAALILLDQILEMCLRDESLKHGASTEARTGEKSFSSWAVPDYLKFLDSKNLLTREQKSYFFKVHDWRNKSQHSGLEPKKEQIAETMKRLEPFIKYGLVCANTLMNGPVIGVDINDPLSRAVKLMKEHDYSQLPVFGDREPVGSICEKNLLDFFLKNGKPPSPDLEVREIVDKPFPLVREDAPLIEVLNGLRTNHAVLVTKKGRVSGIITKANLLNLI